MGKKCTKSNLGGILWKEPIINESKRGYYMTITRNIGFLLLAIYLILVGISGLAALAIPASQIIIGTLPKPVIGRHQVLVRAKAVAVDHMDTYIRSGKYATASSFPYILGRDMVGVVEQIGQEVTNFKPGEKVWTNTQG